MNWRIKPRRSFWIGALSLSAAMMLGACASVETTPIRNTIANAQQAVSDAERMEAHQHAPLELRLAEEKLARARAALEDEEYERADWLADEALADAQLAGAKARTARTENMVSELRASIDALEQEAQRNRLSQ